MAGANVLTAISPEARSPVVRLLGQRGVSRERMVELIAQGVGKAD